MLIHASFGKDLNVKFVKSNGSDLFAELEDNSVDCLIAKFVLHDYQNIGEIFNILWRKLRSDGQILLLDRFWTPPGVAHFVAFWRMELWLVSTLTKKHGIRRGLQYLLEDIATWFSKPWRMHRRRETRISISAWKNIIAAFDDRATPELINASSFWVILCKS